MSWIETGVFAYVGGVLGSSLEQDSIYPRNIRDNRLQSK